MRWRIIHGSERFEIYVQKILGALHRLEYTAHSSALLAELRTNQRLTHRRGAAEADDQNYLARAR
jgi:hypothetical protein